MALTKISTAMWNSVPHHDTHDFNVDDVLYVDVSANRVGIGTTNPTQRAHIYESAAGTGAFLQVQEVGGQNAYFGVNTSGGSIQVSGANPLQIATNGTERMRIDSSGSVIATVDMRAPIFYDSDNTGYYVDPASTSNLNTTSSDLFTAGQLRFKGVGGNSGQTAYDYAIYQAAGAWSYPYPDLIVGWHTGIRIGAYWNYGGIRFYNNSPESAGATEIFSVGNGDDHVRVANYLYAPIFYDSNDTNYYIDPNSASRTSTINGTTFSGVITTSGDGQANIPFRLYSDYNSYMMAVAGSTWGLFWAGNSGARYGTNGNGGPGNIWSNSTNPNEFVFVGGDTTLWTVHGTSGNTWQAGYGQAAGSFRAPIFYDSNDTAYYINPNGGSNVKANFIIQDNGSSSPLFDIQADDAGPWAIRLYRDDLGTGPQVYASDANTWYFNHTVFAGQSIRTNGDARAPIFYDSNDTNYYVDPASTGAISSIKTAGGGQIGTSTAHKLTVAGNGNYMNINYDQIWNAGGNLHLQYSSGYNIDMCAGGGFAWSRTSLRAPLFYDSDNTAYYMNYYGGGALRGNFEFAANSTSTSYQYASIELRESNFTANGTATPPFISFHWGGVVASSIAIEASGRIAIRNNPGTGYENFIAATISATGDVIAYSSSDERLKDNQKNIDNALEKVESLNGIEFDWNDKQDTFTGHDVGVIAQEVEKVLPEIVNTRDTGYKAVKYEKLVPLLIEAIKELSEKVKILENK